MASQLGMSGSEPQPARVGRGWWKERLRELSAAWSSVAGRVAFFSALGFVAVVLVSTNAIQLACQTNQEVGALVPEAAAVNATAVKLHTMVDRERVIIDGLIVHHNEKSNAPARRAAATVAAEMRNCLVGKDGCVAPPARVTGTIGAAFAAMLTAGADASRSVGENHPTSGIAITRFDEMADRVQRIVGEWQEQKFTGLLAQLAALNASTRSAAVYVMAGAIGCLLVGLLGLIAVCRMLGRQRRLTTVMLHLAQGVTGHEVPFRDMQGEIGQMARALDVFVHTSRGLAKRKAELRLSNERLAATLNNMSQGVCMYDAEHRLVICNARARQIVGLPAEMALEGLTCFEFVDLAVGQGSYGGESAQGMKERLRTNMAGHLPVTFVQELADGRTLSHWITPMSDGGWVITFEDITERRAAEAQLAHMAHHDALTGLANRVLFRAELQKAVTKAGRGDSAAVLYVDLDHFKKANDTLGHPVGDVLLCAAAERLRDSVRETDLVARLGGDEFAIIQSSGGQPDAAAGLAGRLVAALAEPFDMNGHQVVIGGCVGIAHTPADGTDPDELMRKADLALYQAKADGRGTYRFFEPSMCARLHAQSGVEALLRAALPNGEFELHYQAQTDLVAREIVGFEALLRWHAPGRGLVCPAEFIPVAEANGLIVPIGAWVLHQACAEAATWPDHLSVAVNLSAVQFQASGLLQCVRSALDSSGIAPHRLELEITETAMMAHSGGVLQTLHDLRALGVRIAMDDFGTGYSSLSYLQRFPFDKIKIDQSFVRGLAGEEGCDAIIRAVVGLGKSLGIETLAEG
ncbi:MAG: EAL domain-containing protein, partial [Proteobacteria bacterium]|nr:EAL domain-containing protein [Pseudomonadota bacterium]